MRNNINYNLLFIVICLCVAFILFIIAIMNQFRISPTYCVIHDDYDNCMIKK